MVSESLKNIVAMLQAGAGKASSAGMSVAEWRQSYDGLGQMLPRASAVECSSVMARGVAAEWLSRPGRTERTVLYLHGGGYCIGSLDSHRAMLTHLASASEAQVLAVDYRLAPEHPHPAALDDAVAVYRWLVEDQGLDPSRIVLAGDSAGGGLTLATLIALRDGGIATPAAGVCLSPWADLTQSGTTIVEKAGADPMVRVEDLDRWAAMYAGGRDPRLPLISPLFADLAGLPPLLIEVGTSEVLLDDARRLAERATRGGADVQLTTAEEMIHVWHFFAGVVPEADDGIRRVADFVIRRTG